MVRSSKPPQLVMPPLLCYKVLSAICPIRIFQQISRLSSLKRLSLACEASVLLRDWDLVTRSVCRAYDLLLPLLGVAAMGRFLFQVTLTKRRHQLLDCYMSSFKNIPTKKYDQRECFGFKVVENTSRSHDFWYRRRTRPVLSLEDETF